MDHHSEVLLIHTVMRARSLPALPCLPTMRMMSVRTSAAMVRANEVPSLNILHNTRFDFVLFVCPCDAFSE